MKRTFVLYFWVMLSSAAAQLPQRTAYFARDTFFPERHVIACTHGKQVELTVSEFVLLKALRAAVPEFDYFTGIEKIRLTTDSMLLVFRGAHRSAPQKGYSVAMLLRSNRDGLFFLQPGYMTCDGTSGCSQCQFGINGCTCASEGTCNPSVVLQKMSLKAVPTEVD